MTNSFRILFRKPNCSIGLLSENWWWRFSNSLSHGEESYEMVETSNVSLNGYLNESHVCCHVMDDQLAPAGMQYLSFTLLLAGVACPHVWNLLM
jgi:hypothetical protein